MIKHSKEQTAVKVQEQTDDEFMQEVLEEKRQQKIEGYISICRSIYMHPLISSKTRREYEEDVFTYMRTTTAEDAKQNIGWLEGVVAKVEDAERVFHGYLNEAMSHHWIGVAERQYWMSYFHDPDLLEMEREHWLDAKFPRKVARWKKIADDRDAVLSRARALGVDVADEPELRILKSHSSFLSRDERHRRELVDRVDGGLIAASRGKKRDFDAMYSHVREACRGSSAFIHTSAPGTLLKQVFNAADPRQYYQAHVLPLLAERKRLREDYDDVRTAFDTATVVPVGVRMPSIDQFLKWDEGHCSTFLPEARHRLQAAVREQQKEETVLDADKKAIRSSMDSKDWRGAEAALQSLRATHPEDTELPAICAFLEAHRDDTKPEEQPGINAVLKSIDALMNIIPSGMKTMYAEAVGGGVDTLNSLMVHMSRAVWEADRREFEGVPALKPERQVPKKPETPEQLTADEEQVTNDVRVSVQRVVAGEEEELDAFESQQEGEKPAILAVGNDAESQKKALNMLVTQDSSSEKARHHGVVSASVTLRQQRHLVDHVNGPLMSYLRTLKERGVPFAIAA